MEVESGFGDPHRVSVGAPFIFFIVIGFQFGSRYLQHLKKKAARTTKEVELRAEIKKLLKEATTLSQPSTFAQAAKLRRLAAAKEKELATHQESHSKELNLSYDGYIKALFIAKVVIYFLFVCWFWRTPVAAISKQLVQPFGRVLSWRAGGSSDNNVMVGIIPWLILSTRVSKFATRFFN